jgi:hypothetical protein
LAEGVAQIVVDFPSMHKALGSNPRTTKETTKGKKKGR